MGRTSKRLDGKFEPHECVAALQEKHRKLRANIDAAYDDKLKGKIAEDFWLRRTNVWQEEIAKVAAEIKTLQDATFDGETLTPRYKEPFDALAEGLEDQTGGPDDPFKRTFAARVVRWAGRRTRKATPATVFALAA